MTFKEILLAMLNDYNHRQTARFVLKHAISVRASGEYKGRKTYTAIMCDETTVHMLRYKNRITIQYIYLPE